MLNYSFPPIVIFSFIVNDQYDLALPERELIFPVCVAVVQRLAALHLRARRESEVVWLLLRVKKRIKQENRASEKNKKSALVHYVVIGQAMMCAK